MSTMHHCSTQAEAATPLATKDLEDSTDLEEARHEDGQILNEDLGILAVLEELGDVIGRRHNLRQLADEDLVQLLKLRIKLLGIQGGYLCRWLHQE